MQITERRGAVAHEQLASEAMRKRRLLCATDLTSRSERVLQRTALLARQMNAEAVFLHAVEESMPGRALRMKVNRAYVRLSWESGRVMKHAPQDATAWVRLGDHLDVIAATARDYGPDLIVMAKPRPRRLDMLMGTTAERLIRNTNHSLLAVSGAADRPYERVVLATDLSSTSAHVVRTVVEMGMLKHAYAWVVHAFGLPYQEIVTADRLDDREFQAHRAQWAERIRGEVLQNLQDAGVDLARVHVSTELARPLGAIQRAIERVQPELLVIGTSRWFTLKRILVGSVADGVFRNVGCDILAIAPPAAPRTWRKAA